MAHDSVILGKNEHVIDIWFRRTSAGRLKVTVKAHPMLEEIFKGWSITGETTGVDLHGRSWQALEGDEPLEAYLLNFPIPTTAMGRNLYYRVDRLGTLLIESDEGGRPMPGQVQVDHTQVINLGFLRLKGISDENGKSFILRGVFSTEGIQEMSKLCVDAARRLFMDYMRPVDLNVVIITKEA